MTDIDLTKLEPLLEVARKHGVEELTYEGGAGRLSFKLGSLPAVAAAPTKRDASAPAHNAPPMCACGHPTYDHNANGCVHCGPSEKCLKKEKRHGP